MHNKMLMIVYNEALDDEVMELFQGCKVQSYTKVAGVFGKGELSGAHLGNDIWPGRNNILYVACDEEQSRCMLGRVNELRNKLGHEGIKVFVLPIEYST